VVSVLGPLRVEGLRRPIRRTAVTRLRIALALTQDRAVSVEELRDLGATHPDRPLSVDDVHGHASKLRTSLPAGTLPPIAPGDGGYRLTDRVDVDWTIFRALADPAASTDGSDQIDLRLRALGLIRGRILDHATWPGIDRVVRDVEQTVETVAVDTARHALTRRDTRSAETAITAGLRALPESPILWQLRLIAAAGGSGVGLHRAWADAQRTLGPDAQPLAPVYEALRNGTW
jgi:hypothetical protein